MKKIYMHVYLIQKYIKDILKCLFLRQLYTTTYKYANVQRYIYIKTRRRNVKQKWNSFLLFD